MTTKIAHRETPSTTTPPRPTTRKRSRFEHLVRRAPGHEGLSSAPRPERFVVAARIPSDQEDPAHHLADCVKPEERSWVRASRDGSAGDDALASFAPPPHVLTSPLSAGVVEVVGAADPTSRVLAEVAAMADRMVTSMSFGRVGRDGHALEMRLSLGKRGSLGVALSLRGDDLQVDLTPDDLTSADVEALVRALEGELGVNVSLR